MRKFYILGFIAAAILLFSTMTTISADIDGIFEVWMSQEGKMTLVSIYNEDCTECYGKEYQDRVCQLAEGGCTYCGMCYSGSFSGDGAGPQLGSYEENKFVKTTLTTSGYGDDAILYWRRISIAESEARLKELRYTMVKGRL